MTGRTVLERGRLKAYRPMPDAARRAAFSDGLAAYDRGDWFLAHELLEPAWMGAADPSERTLHSGLIKLAAAGVHGARGNPKGIVTNLVGARARLASLVDAPVSGTGLPAPVDLPTLPAAARIDLPALVDAIDRRLRADPARPALDDPPAIPRRG